MKIESARWTPALSARGVQSLTSIVVAFAAAVALLLAPAPMRFVLLALALFGAALTITFPRFILPVFFLSWPFLQQLLGSVTAASVGSLEVTGGQALGAGLFIVYLGLYIKGRPLAIARRPGSIAFLALVSLAFVAMWFSHDRPAAIATWMRLATGMLILFVSQDSTLSWATKRRIVLYSFLGIGLSAALTLVHFFGAVKLGYALPYLDPANYMETDGVVRSIGALGRGADGTGILYFVGIMYGCYLWQMLRTRWHLVLIMVVMASGVVVTFARSSILALLFAVSLAALLTRRPGARLKILAICGLVIVAGTVMLLVVHGPEAIDSRIRDIPIIGEVGVTQPEAGTHRLALWRNLWSFFLDSTLLEKLVGHGLQGAFHDRGHYGYLTEFLGAHNDYLMILIELGLVGLFLYGLFILGLTRRLMFLIRSPHPMTKGMAFVCLCFGAAFLLVIANTITTVTLAGYRHYFLMICGFALSAAARGPAPHHAASPHHERFPST